jgi:hypothetical protein
MYYLANVYGRHDYFPSAKLLVLRMPGLLHESLASYITQEILRQLNTIAQSESPSAEFARDIENNASAEINFADTEYGSHQPDASFQHFEAQYPGVILELSYSQKKKDLSRLANEYISWVRCRHSRRNWHRCRVQRKQEGIHFGVASTYWP